MNAPPSVDPIERLASVTRAHCGAFAAALGDALDHWPQRVHAAVPAGAPLPVLRWLVPALRACTVHSISQALGEAPLAWRQSYTLAEAPAGFLDNYGFAPLVGPGAPLESRALACGFLLLGPRTHYPSHAHEAEEFYVPLSGPAEWQQGDESWRLRAPGELIRHATHEPHAMRTAAEPLLAIYLWRGAGIGASARFAPGGATHL